jgi:very-short-patch-repair endonuclease
MLVCHLCHETFTNNVGGQLTLHLRNVHAVSLGDRFVVLHLGGVEPRCACGLCSERPEFVRGAFKKYASHHRRFDVREQLYRTKHGDPTCEQCGKSVRFARGVPRRYCSLQCAIIGKGFSRPETQLKVLGTVRARYGVDNVSQVDEVRRRIGRKGVSRRPSDATKQLMSGSLVVRWADAKYRTRTSAAIKRGVNTPEERLRRSKQMTIQMSDPEFQRLVWAKHHNRLTKMHQQFRKALTLDELGFISERRIGRWWVDELNERAKLIIEFNGDYPHANPRLYAADDVIRLRGQSYTAREKWVSDAARIEGLQQMGYAVVVVWQSDDIEDVRVRVLSMLACH